ncbi:MAG TPA: hypothetical protein DER10_11735 [Elusimicrobia bacterium]|nr:hypothetical protein [Elusimicrobiota bacterium]
MLSKIINLKFRPLLGIVWPCLILFAVGVWFYAPIIFMQRRIDWDAYALSYPSLLFLSDSFHSGIFPFWNPFVMSGDAFLGQCAAFAYHPIFVLAALLPQNWNLYYIFELLLLLTAFLGGIGAYLYLQFLVKNKIAAVAGAAVFMTAAFIPLLGQPAVACGIASLPWFLLCAEWVLATPCKIEPVKISVFSLLLGLSFISSYFGAFLYNIIFLALYSAFRVVEMKRSGGPIAPAKMCVSFCAAGFAAVLLAAPYLFAGIENRVFLYKDLLGDFVSPDPRLRGMALSRVVNIIPHWADIFHVLAGSPRFSADIPKWVFGIGYIYLFLYVGSFFIRNKPKLLLFFNFTALLSSFYVIGTHGFVFKFASHHIPVLGNIRYPSFGFYILQFSLVACGTMALSWFMREFNPRNRHTVLLGCVLAALLAADLSFYTRRSGIFERHVYFAASPEELSLLSMRDRVKSVVVKNPLRFISKTKEYDFENVIWIMEKVLFNQGYSTYDSPYYWYMKNLDFLEKVFSIPAKVIPAPDLKRADYKTDNAYVEALAAAVAAADRAGAVMVDRLPAGFSQAPGSCEILNSQAGPNSFKAVVYAKKKCFLSLNDKFYPGWHVSVNGLEAELVKGNFIFKGVFLAPGQNMVEFRFVPVVFYAGVLISALTLLSLGIPLVLYLKRQPGAI